jgi:hypothetical protein
MSSHLKKRNEGAAGSGGSGLPPVENRTRREKTEHDIFLEKFYGCSKKTIRPVMEHVMELIKQKGFDSEIAERKEMAGPDGRIRNAEIRLTIFPPGCRSGSADPENCPAVVFAVLPFTDIIRIQESRRLPEAGWLLESAGDVPPEKVTDEMVSDHILRVIGLAAGSP